MKIEVLLFAGLRESVGAPQITVEVPTRASVDDLRSALQRENSAFSRAKFAIAVNRQISSSYTRLAAGDEVACIPPVGGG